MEKKDIRIQIQAVFVVWPHSDDAGMDKKSMILVDDNEFVLDEHFSFNGDIIDLWDEEVRRKDQDFSLNLRVRNERGKELITSCQIHR